MVECSTLHKMSSISIYASESEVEILLLRVDAAENEIILLENLHSVLRAWNLQTGEDEVSDSARVGSDLGLNGLSLNGVFYALKQPTRKRLLLGGIKQSIIM